MLYLLITLLILFIIAVAAIHYGFRAPRLTNTTLPDQIGYPFEKTTFSSAKGSQLRGWWIPSSKSSEVTVIMLHGWGANKSLMLPLARPFLKSNTHVFLFDARNHGDSDQQGVSSMPKFAEDLLSAIDFIKQNYAKETQTLIILGHSVGAAATLLAASRTNKVNGVIAISSFAHPQRVMRRHLHKLNKLPGLIWLISAYVQWIIGHQFDDIAPINTVKNLQHPLLIVHGKEDDVIPIEDHYLICAAANQTLSEGIEIEKAKHDSIHQIEQHFFIIHRFIKRLTEKTNSNRNALKNN